MTLILNTTILQSAVFTPAITTALTAGNAALLLALYFCFWRGLLAVQKKAGLPAQAGGALALIVWYALVCVLAAVQYSGWVIPITMLIGYGFILRSLCRLSGALDEAGYAIAPKPVRVTDRCLVLVIAAVLGIGCTLRYLFGGSYPMDWQPVDASTQAQTAAIRQQLLGLGFPEDVLNDLTPEDIAACDGALRVVTKTEDYPSTTAEPSRTRKATARAALSAYWTRSLMSGAAPDRRGRAAPRRAGDVDGVPPLSLDDRPRLLRHGGDPDPPGLPEHPGGMGRCWGRDRARAV